MPIPVSPAQTSPVLVTARGTGYGYITSGIAPVSGVSGTIPSGVNTSGPWFIEEQWMDIFYARVPIATRSELPDRDVSLSSVNTSALGKSNNISMTFVACNVKGRVNATSSTTVYSGPYQIPQKFEIVAFSADYRNRAYGSVSSGAMGPAGSIRTVQKFYARRLLRANDTFYDETCWDGYTYQIESAYPINAQAEYMNRFQKWIGWGTSSDPWGYLTECAGIAFYDTLVPQLGGYTTTQDAFLHARQTANECGGRLQSGKLWDARLRGITTDGAIYPLTHYDINRHDFS